MLAQDEQPIAAATAHISPLVALAIVAATLTLLPVCAWIMRKLVPIREEMRVHWGFREVALVGLAGFVGALFAGLRVRTLLARHDVPDVNAILFLSAVSTGIPVLFAATVAIVRDPDGIAALGLRTGSLLRAPLAGLMCWMLMLPGLGAVASLWVWTLQSAGETSFEQPLIEILSKVEPGQRLVPVLYGVLVIPFFEEVLFRGFLQPVLVQRLKPVAGIAVTSAIFAVLHGVEAAVPIFVLSCMLGYVMMRTQRLHAAWTVHAVHNGLQFLILYNYPELLNRSS